MESKHTKVDMKTGTVIWQNTIACISATCATKHSPVLVSDDQTKVYSTVAFTGGEVVLIWTVYDYSNGSVIGNQYDVSNSSSNVKDMVEQAGYIYLLNEQTAASNTFLTRFDPDTSTFEVIVDS